MNHVLISVRDDLIDRWLAVFPDGRVTSSLKQALRVPKKKSPLYWMDLTIIQSEDWVEAVEELSVRGKLVVFSPKPSQPEATLLIRGGRWGTATKGRRVFAC